MSSDLETLPYDKRFAVFSSSNPSTSESQTDNLIHESGRLQLNTYQAFVQNLMNPQSDLRALLLVHMTGTGKTITALATATEYVRQYQPNAESSSVSSVVVLGFTKDIFKKELLTHPEFAFVNIDEATELKQLEQRMQDMPNIAEQYQSAKKKYLRRLARREVKGIYQFYGYRQFANRILNMEDIQTMLTKLNKGITEAIDVLEFDPQLVKKWIEDGDVRINTNFIRSLARSLVICDEVHNLYKNENLNTYGLAIQIVFDYFFKTLKPNDIDYGAIRALLLSATPLTTTALEIIPIATLLTGDDLKYDDLFKITNGVDQLTQHGLSTVRHAISGRVSYIMDDNPKEYPKPSFEGGAIKGINYLKFIRAEPESFQKKSISKWAERSAATDERGINMIKDITLPATADCPNGVFFSKNISDLSELPAAIAVHKSQNGILSSNIFALPTLRKYSCKYAKLVSMCLDMKSPKHGKMFIFHPLVQGSGTDLLCSILIANGFVLEGNTPVNESICMNCNKTYGSHSKEHEFVPVQFTFITGSLSKAVVASRLTMFNNDANVYGERVKIIIGSRAMRESHTLKACRHVIIAHEPSSISEMIQIIGRAVRKHVHDILPSAMRTVQIHILTTNVSNIAVAQSDTAANEEHAYKQKVLQFEQINRIERIMYDVSIDYLINFRFKLRETPPLLGEAYSLDQTMYQRYEKTLTKAYNEIRNGTAPTGIHTNRFNIFYFESEVRLVCIIIKRIILDHHPVITIKDIKTIIRSPPFHIEYNTNLISDEAIAVAINKICFRRDQLRVIAPVDKTSLTDALFDQTSTLLDTVGNEYKIVCIGNPLCLASYLTKQLTRSIVEGDNSLIDSFRQQCTTLVDRAIDLQDLAARWASTIDINDVLDDIREAFQTKGATSAADSLLKKLPAKSHSLLADWLITTAVSFAIQKQKVSASDIEIAKYLANYYRSRRLIIVVSDLKHTRIYGRLKQYDTNTGTSWFNKVAKPSTGAMPIGHLIENMIRVYLPSDKSWADLNTIGDGFQSKHPLGFYIYEERIDKTLSIALKIRYDADKKAKGITMGFLQRTNLEEIAKALKVVIKDVKLKGDIIDKIESAAWTQQEKIYPKRIIYRLVDQ